MFIVYVVINCVIDNDKLRVFKKEVYECLVFFEFVYIMIEFELLGELCCDDNDYLYVYFYEY